MRAFVFVDQFRDGPLRPADLAAVEQEAVFVPQVPNHRFARQTAAAPRAIHLDSRFAAIDQEVEAAALIHLMLQLTEPFETRAGGKPRRERPNDA